MRTAVLASLLLASLITAAHAQTPSMAVVCPSASAEGQPVVSSCNAGSAQAGQVYKTPTDADLVRVDPTRAAGQGADWSNATSYTWKKYGNLAAGELFERCKAPQLPEGTLVNLWTCTAWEFVPKPAGVSVEPGKSAVLTWSAPTLHTDGTAFTDLTGFKVWQGATTDALLVVATLPATTLTWTSPPLPVGTHQFAVSAFNAARVDGERSPPMPAVVASVALPTISLSVTPTDGVERVTPALTWSSSNATACTSSGGWSGARAVSGSFAPPAITADATYTLTCTGPGGSATVSASVKVSKRPAAPGGFKVTLQ